MFDTELRPYLKHVAPRNMPKLTGYLHTLTQEINYNLHRYNRSYGTETPGVVLLEHILGEAPIEEMRQTQDQFERYRIIDRVILSLERMVDPTYWGKNKRVSFLDHSHSKTSQFLFPTSGDNPLVNLPIGMGWLNWKRVRPFRVASISTNELTFHAYQDALKYRADVPEFAVFTINITSLVLMYCSYLDTLDDIPPSAMPNFLHQYVVFPSLLEDNVALWVRNQYSECLDRRVEINTPHADTAWITANNGRIGSQYPQFVQDVYQLITQCQQGTLTPNALLASLKLPHDEPVLTYRQVFNRDNQLPDLRQYRWQSYLVDEQWLDLIIRVSMLNPQWDAFSYTSAYLTRTLELFQASHPWSDVSDVTTRTYIENSVQRKLDLLDGK